MSEALPNVEELWQQFEEEDIGPEANIEERLDMRAAFFSGAAAIIGVLMAADSGEITVEDAQNWLLVCHQELASEFSSMVSDEDEPEHQTVKLN